VVGVPGPGANRGGFTLYCSALKSPGALRISKEPDRAGPLNGKIVTLEGRFSGIKLE